MTAPAAAGNYNFQWAMLREGVEWFGSPSTNLIVNVVAPSRVNASTVVAQSVPAQMTAGQTYPVSVVMQNTGTTTWTTADQYSFGIPTTDGVQLWNSGWVPLSGPVAPGGQVAFNFNVVAPPAGSYNFWGVMVQDGVEWFGASSYVPVNVSPGRSNNAQFVSQNVSATMIPGQPYAVTVVMQNIGTTTWTAHGNTGLAAANPLGNNTWSVVRIDQPTTTAPGQTASYTFQVTAPASQGTYNFQWKMVQDGVEWFGAETPNLAIQVTSNSDTVTYIHTDALGSPVARSDSAGNVIAASRTSYEPYGRTALGATPTIGFTGHVNDADTGLVYMQQRYYDPVAGRFLSVDPVTTDMSSGQNFSRYKYGENNPYRYTDPDGRFSASQCADMGSMNCGNYSAIGSGDASSAKNKTNQLTTRSFMIDSQEFDVVGGSNDQQKRGEAYVRDIVKSPRGKQMLAVLQARRSLFFFRQSFTVDFRMVNNAFSYMNDDKVFIDPNYTHNIETTSGSIPMNLRRIIAHEMGHAVFGTRDSGPGKMKNINENENPIMQFFGEPARIKY